VSDETGYPACSVGLSSLLLPLPHLPGASTYVIGILLSVADTHMQSHMYQINNSIQKYFFSSLIQKYKKMKYVKNFYLWRCRHLLVEEAYQDPLRNRFSHRDSHLEL
jgi:hypothetical protein